MKKIMAFAAAVAAIISFTSCDNRPNPAGMWTSTITDNVPGEQKTMDVTLTFGSDGSVQGSYAITIVEDQNGNDSIVTPFQTSVTASVTQNGTWQYVDGEDDEILLTFDKNSLSVNIAPDGIDYRVNVLTGQETPSFEPLTPAFIAKYTQELKDDFLANSTPTILEDVKVTKSMMKFEIGKTDYVFTGTQSK